MFWETGGIKLYCGELDEVLPHIDFDAIDTVFLSQPTKELNAAIPEPGCVIALDSRLEGRRLTNQHQLTKQGREVWVYDGNENALNASLYSESYIEALLLIHSQHAVLDPAFRNADVICAAREVQREAIGITSKRKWFNAAVDKLEGVKKKGWWV